MNILTAEQITKSFTERKLLDHVSFSLQEGEKAGVIGINGTGKTTLLKILAGLEEPDEGEVVLANHVIVRYLPQDPQFPPDRTVLEWALEAARGHGEAWDVEGETKAMLTRLGAGNYSQKIGELSGGQKKRLALAAVLLAPADILVLDESRIPWPGHFSLRERLERFLYLGDDRDVLHKYVAGERLF